MKPHLQLVHSQPLEKVNWTVEFRSLSSALISAILVFFLAMGIMMLLMDAIITSADREASLHIHTAP